jgi:hypothetical protein
VTTTAVNAPFTVDQVASLNAYQESEYVHPYTCGSPDCPSQNWAVLDQDHLPMAADADGLHCIEGMGCTYLQTWAHAWTADWSWKSREARAQRG